MPPSRGRRHAHRAASAPPPLSAARRAQRSALISGKLSRATRLVRKLNGVGSSSPGCNWNCDQSMVRPSRRGGVPVFRRQPRKPRFFSDSPKSTAEGSPLRPAGYCCSPQWINPLRNVPVVMMTAPARTVRPSRRCIPRTSFREFPVVSSRFSVVAELRSAGQPGAAVPT